MAIVIFGRTTLKGLFELTYMCNDTENKLT